MIEKVVNIVVKEQGLDAINKKVVKLDHSIDELKGSNTGLTKSMGDSSNAILENGGAMGLLNDATLDNPVCISLYSFIELGSIPKSLALDKNSSLTRLLFTIVVLAFLANTETLLFAFEKSVVASLTSL